MNREIKFRAWDGERLRNVNTIGWLDEEIDWVDTPRYSGPIYDNIKIMQYTGLTDTNGIEIYEGDIVSYTMLKFNGVGYETEEEYGVVEYGDAVFEINGVPLYVAHAEDDEIEIIGNILEDGDLLDS